MRHNNDLEDISIEKDVTKDADLKSKQSDADNIFLDDKQNNPMFDDKSGDDDEAKALESQFQFEKAKNKDELIISGRQPEIFNAFKHGGDGPDIGQVDVPDDLSSNMDDEWVDQSASDRVILQVSEWVSA